MGPTQLAEATRREKETLRLSRHVVDLATLGRKIAAGKGVGEADLQPGLRTRGVVGVRRLFCQLTVRELGHSGAEVARLLGVTT